MDKVNLAAKLAMIPRPWEPHVVGELNGQHVRLAKLLGTFDWHSHAEEDELFLVVAGEFDMQFRDRVVTVGVGEFLIVPRGVEHRPHADREAHVLLFEPATTINTGNVKTARTIERLEHL